MIKLTYIVFAFTTFLTVWLNVKFIKDSKGQDQYWHTVQLYQQIWIYISYAVLLIIFGADWKYVTLNFLPILFCWALMYMLLYNSLLNMMRKLSITHLGRFDFLKFYQTVILFVIGLILAIKL